MQIFCHNILTTRYLEMEMYAIVNKVLYPIYYSTNYFIILPYKVFHHRITPVAQSLADTSIEEDIYIF